MKPSELGQAIAWVVLVGCFVLFGLSSNATLFLFLGAMIVLGPLPWYLSLLKINIDNPDTSKKFFIWDTIIIILSFVAAAGIWYFLRPHLLPDIEGNISINNSISAQFARDYKQYFLAFPLISYLLALPLIKRSAIIAICFLFLAFLMMGAAAFIGMSSNIG